MASGIYGLVDSEQNTIVYVGRSIDIEARFKDHRREMVKAGRFMLRQGWVPLPVMRDKNTCLAYLWLEGIPLDVTVLEDLPGDVNSQVEQEHRWAASLTQSGFPLCNGTRSGTNLAWQGQGRSKNPCPYTPGLETFPIKTIPLSKRLHVGMCREIVHVNDLSALNRLRDDAPSLHARVLAGELSPHATVVRSPRA